MRDFHVAVLTALLLVSPAFAQKRDNKHNDAFVNGAFHRFRRPLDCRSYECFFLLEKIAEHIIGRAFGRCWSNADTQPWNFLSPELNDDRFETVMAARSPALSNSQPT